MGTAHSKMKKEKVLVLEQDKSTRNALKILLELNDIEVATADDRNHALKKIDNEPFDLILCSSELAIDSELNLLEKIKFHPKHFRIPIIILSHSADEMDRRTMADLGADDYITKPFSGKILLNTIKLKINNSNAHRKLAEREYHEKVFALLNKDFSQEMVTSLNGISNATFLLESLPGSEEIDGLKDLVQIIESSKFRIQRAVQNLRMYASLSLEKIPGQGNELKSVNLQDILRSVLKKYEQAGENTASKVDIEMLHIGNCEGYEYYLATLFTELIDNALKFNSGAYLPHIKLHAVNNNFTFSVTNYVKSAPHFTVGDIAPFTKFHHDLSYNGLGLGLALCIGICEKMNYKFSVNKEGNFITFLIESE